LYARVAILTERGALTETYTYQIPEHLKGVRPGTCLLVPLQKQVRIGYAVELLPEPDVPRLRAALGRVPGSDIPDERVELAQWMARYWCAPVGACLRLMMPPVLRGRIERRVRALCESPPEGPGAQPRRCSSISSQVGPPPRPRLPGSSAARRRIGRLPTSGSAD